MKNFFRLRAAATIVLLHACASSSPMPTDPVPKQSETRIWNVKEKKFIPERDFIQAAMQADFILLGERHDHPAHHRLQARIIQDLVDTGKHPVVAFEMLSADQQPFVNEQVSRYANDITGLGKALQWDQSGWPPWPLYAPIFATAIRNGLPILAADVSSPMKAKLHAEGLMALQAEWRARYELNHPLASALQQALRHEIEVSHCGYIQGPMIDVLVDFQRARDASLADQLIAANRQTVLVTGNGHARSDRGVPLYLRIAAPDKRAVSLGFVETAAGTIAPKEVARDFGTEELPFDYVWFTESMEQKDPCVEFRKSLEKMKSRGG